MKGIASTGAPKTLLGGWVGGWMDGRESRVKYCLQQSKRDNPVIVIENLDLWLHFLSIKNTLPCCQTFFPKQKEPMLKSKLEFFINKLLEV
jgi:hypothetical protein